MKVIFSILVLCCARAAFGFDSEDWLLKRAVLDQEADRLQKLYDKCVQALQQPAENLVVPLESYPDGKAKATLSAARAQYFLDEGFVWGENVTVREFDPSGKELGEVKATNCVIDRATKSGFVKGHAKAVYGGTTVQGDGIYFSFDEEYVKILSNAVIESKDVKLEGVKL